MPFDGTNDIIAQAQDILRRGGWTRDTERNVQGQHCVLGALAAADSEWFNTRLARALESEAIIRGADPRLGGSPVVQWNDKIAKDVDDVIAFLDAVRARL